MVVLSSDTRKQDLVGEAEFRVEEGVGQLLTSATTTASSRSNKGSAEL